MKRCVVALLFLLLFPLSAVAAPARKALTYGSVLSGKVVPLTVKYQSLDRNWRRFSASGVQPQPASALAAIYGASSGTVYYTKGQTVAVQGETYLVAYSAASKGPDMAAFIASRGQAVPRSEAPTAESVLELCLLNVRSMGSMTNIRPFDLQAELAAAAEAANSLQAVMQSVTPAGEGEGSSRLKSLALAINMYAVDEEVLPSLADGEALRAELMDYVRDATAFKDEATGEDFAFNASLSGRAMDSIADPAGTMVAYQAAPDAEGKRQVAFLDASVRTVDDQEWKELMTQPRVSGRLKQLAIALDMCSGDNGGVLPNLADPAATRAALDEYVGNEDTFRDEATGEYFLFNPSLAGKPVASIADPKATVVAYQASPAEDGTRGVVFVDWHVWAVNEAEWARLKAASGIE